MQATINRKARPNIARSSLLALFLGLTLPTIAVAFDAPWDQGHVTTGDDRPSPPPPPRPCGNNRGSPVYVATGDLIWSETDITIAGREPLTLVRNYNSFDSRDGIFGKGWSANCEPTLIKIEGVIASQLSTDVEVVGKQAAYVLRQGDGRRQFFTWSADHSTIIAPSWGFETVEPQADGTVKLSRLDGSFRHFDALGRLLASVDLNGVSMTYIRDEQGRLTRKVNENGQYIDFVYDNTGHVSQVTDNSGRTWQYAYDSEGALISVTDPIGGVRQYTYQAYEIVDYADNYQPETAGIPSNAITSPSGTVSNYQQLIAVTDATGVEELAVTYDDRRVNSYTEQANTYTYTYPRPAAFVTNTLTKIDSRGSRWIYVYDEISHLILEATDPANNIETWTYNENSLVASYTDKEGQTWEYTHDSNGRRTYSKDPLGRETRWTYDGERPWPLKVTSPSGRETSFVYDANGNPTQITDPSGAVTQMSYNDFGDLTVQIDPSGRRTEFSYNALGLLEQFTDPSERVTQLTYDALGRVTRTVNNAGDLTELTYDGLDRMTSQTNNLNEMTQTSYDLAGRLLSVNDGRGTDIAVYGYDEFGRKISATESGVEYSFIYDENNTLTSRVQGDITTTYQYDARRLPISMSADGITIRVRYDSNGRPITQSGNGASVNYGYDVAGQIIQADNFAVGYNTDGQLSSYTTGDDLVQYGYDNRGLMSAVTTSAGVYAYQYDPRGLVNKIVPPAGSVISYDHDASGQITEQDYSGDGGFTYQYTYDTVGRVESVSGDTSHQYNYDSASRLTDAVIDGNGYSYLYDENANRLENDQVYSPENRLLENSQFSYFYDERGNLIKKVDKFLGAYTDYSFNGLNQLISLNYFSNGLATAAETVATYRYDAMGRRITKTVNNRITSFVWMGSQLLSETRPDGTTYRYRYAKGYAPIEVSDGSSTWTVHSDHLDTPRVLTDQNNTVVWQSQSSPYGISEINEDPDGDGIELEFNFRLPGQYLDAESGLHYNYFRYYDPSTGRYVSNDPIGLAGGINTYLYANSNPINYIDPTGENPLLAAVVVRAAIAAAWRAMNRAIRRCAGVPACRCRAFNTGYHALQAIGCSGCSIPSPVCCAVTTAQAAAAGGVVTLRAGYIAANCDTHLPGRRDHPGQLREAQRALVNCSAKAGRMCRRQCLR